MSVSPRRSWLVLLFRLPASRASARVGIWRKLRAYGALPWQGSSYVLADTPPNLERFQWVLADIRKHGGDGSIVAGAHVEATPGGRLETLFNAARTREYEALMNDMRKALRAARRLPTGRRQAAMVRFSRRFAEIAERDAFKCPTRQEAGGLLRQLERTGGERRPRNASPKPVKPYQGRVWMTRPRPEIDRVASAWFIRCFVDPGARFVFSSDPHAHRGAIRFDMFPPQPGAPPDAPGFTGLFTHVGDACTFEVLVATFRSRDRTLRTLAQIIHDADLEDDKYGRAEGAPLQMMLRGWAAAGMPDHEILERGGVCLDGLAGALHRPVNRGRKR